jgi:hypothetical protein
MEALKEPVLTTRSANQLIKSSYANESSCHRSPCGMRSAYPPHRLHCDALLFPHLGTSSSDDAYWGRPTLNSCKIFPHQCVKGREPRVNRGGNTAAVKREPGDMVGGISQLLTRPC